MSVIRCHFTSVVYLVYDSIYSRLENSKMDLSKVKDDEKLKLCRWYYRGGFAFLPFLWGINFVWFFNDAFVRSVFDEQKDIRKYVLRSGVGAFIWIVALICWVAVFQTQRIAWGDWGDELSFIIPTGSA